MVIDKNRYIQDVNPILCEIFGYKTKDELIGKDVKILHIDNNAYKDFTQRVLVQSAIDETIKIRFEFKKKDGHYKYGVNYLVVHKQKMEI